MLPISQDLLRWLRQHPAQWRRTAWSTRARLQWNSYWNTVNLRLSQARLPMPRSSEPAPWLILGCWRSGTTVMHELLAAATGLPTPRTWQCMSACSFALLGTPPERAAIARPMDGLQIGPLSPQEDEFALLSMGVDSAYRAFLVPQNLPELHYTLQAAHWLADSDWLQRLEDFLALCRISEGAGAPDAPMLLKSPNHSFRLQALRARWPEARVVWMLRDPTEIYFSNRKMWRQMMDTHQLPGAAPLADDALDAFLAAALHQGAHQLRWLIEQTDSQWVVCDQTALRQDPTGTVQAVLSSIAPEHTPDLARLADAVARTDQGRVEQYDRPVEAPAVREAIQALQAAQAAALARQLARRAAPASQ